MRVSRGVNALIILGDILYKLSQRIRGGSPAAGHFKYTISLKSVVLVFRDHMEENKAVLESY